MRNGPVLRIALLFAASGLVVGCAESGATLGRRTSVGSLKTGLSHVEFENEQLRKEVAELKTQTRDMEDRLVQEESDNGDLRARLDDARHLLSQKGYDVGTEGARAMNGSDDGRGPTTRPAGQSSRTKRKMPFTQIPGRIDMVPPSEPADDPLFDDPKPGTRDEFGPQSQRSPDVGNWLPIAQGTSAPSSSGKVR